MYRSSNAKERTDRVHTSRSARIKERALSSFYFGSNRMSLLICIFALMLFIYGVFYLGEVFLSLSLQIPLPLPHQSVVYIVRGILYLFLSPLLPGLLSYANELSRTAAGKRSGRVPVTHLFQSYASPRQLVRAWPIVTLQLILTVLPVLCPLLVYRASFPFFVKHTLFEDMGVLLFPLLLATVSFLCALYLTASLSPAFYLSVIRPQLSLSRCITAGFLSVQRYLMRAMTVCALFYVFSALSLLLLGIPFFLYVLPLSIVTYVSFSEELSNSIFIES